MLYIAHRGHSYQNKRNENKIIAIKNAIDIRYDGIEIDVQLCNTGEIVLFHDIYIEDTFIKDMTFEELHNEHGIISLEQLYREIPDIQKKLLIVDMKGTNFELIHKLEKFYDAIDTSNTYFCSFNRQLLNTMSDRFNKGSTFEAIFTMKEYDTITKGLRCLVVHWTCLNTILMMHCKLNDIKVFVYTHKTEIQHKHITKFQPDAIITDALVGPNGPI